MAVSISGIAVDLMITPAVSSCQGNCSLCLHVLRLFGIAWTAATFH